MFRRTCNQLYTFSPVRSENYTLPIERAFIMHVVHSSRHIVATQARKIPLVVYLFTTSGEVFIRILTMVFKVGRITKNATFK